MEFLIGFSFDQIQGWIQAGGYVMLFGLLFACGLGLPMPEDIPLIIAGALIAKHQMTWAIAGTCAWCGIIGGDCVLYYMARRYGMNITKAPLIGKHVTRERIEWDAYIEARTSGGGYVPASPLGLLVLAADAQ